MKTFNVKEISDDAIMNIKVNKQFYIMTKLALLTIFKDIHDPSKSGKEIENFIKDVVTKPYEKQDEKERVFYLLTLLVGEIETQANKNDLLVDKEYDVDKLRKQMDDMQ